MRLRTSIYLLLMVALGVFAGFEWNLSRQRGEHLGKVTFLRQRAVFLEAENKRLAALLGKKQADENAVEERRQRDAIEKSVEGLSGLPFKKPVVFKKIDRSDLPKILEEKLARQVPDLEFQSVGMELTALGLVPLGIDLKKVYLGLLGEQIGAFYDQHTHELCTFSEHPLTNAQNRVVMAHELTHALQDQHFDLLKLPLETKGNDDLSLAASALVEGHATVVMNEYLLSDLSAAVLRDSLAGTVSTDVRQLAAAPKYLRETLLFPYLEGQKFLSAILSSGSESAIAEAFSHPPTSTSEILHPEKYLSASQRAPIKIFFPNTSALGKPPVVDNVVGEFTATHVLEIWTHDKARAGRIAEAWRGDRILVFGDQKAYSFVWQTVWHNPGAASEYCRAGQTGLTARYSVQDSGAVQGSVTSDQPNAGFSFNSGGRQVRMKQSGSRTTLIDAQGSQWADALERVADTATDQTLP